MKRLYLFRLTNGHFRSFYAFSKKKKLKNNFQTIIDKIFVDFSDFSIGFRFLGNQEISRKSLGGLELIAPSKRHISTDVLENCQKYAVKNSREELWKNLL